MGRTGEQHGHSRDSSSSALEDCVFRLFVSIQTSNFLLRKMYQKQRLKGKNHLSPFLPSTKHTASAATDWTKCMFCARVRNQLTAPACPQALLGVSPPRSGCRQLLQEYYSGNMPKAKWWDPWKSVYQPCKWSLNIADLCLKLRLHYAQLYLQPKQLLSVDLSQTWYLAARVKSFVHNVMKTAPKRLSVSVLKV